MDGDDHGEGGAAARCRSRQDLLQSLVSQPHRCPSLASEVVPAVRTPKAATGIEDSGLPESPEQESTPAQQPPQPFRPTEKVDGPSLLPLSESFHEGIDVPPAAVPPSPMPEPPLADTPPPPAPRLFSAFRAIPASSGPHHPGAHGPEATTDPLAGSGSVRESPCPSLHPPPSLPSSFQVPETPPMSLPSCLGPDDGVPPALHSQCSRGPPEDSRKMSQWSAAGAPLGLHFVWPSQTQGVCSTRPSSVLSEPFPSTPPAVASETPPLADRCPSAPCCVMGTPDSMPPIAIASLEVPQGAGEQSVCQDSAIPETAASPLAAEDVEDDAPGIPPVAEKPSPQSQPPVSLDPPTPTPASNAATTALAPPPESHPPIVAEAESEAAPNALPAPPSLHAITDQSAPVHCNPETSAGCVSETGEAVMVVENTGESVAPEPSATTEVDVAAQVEAAPTSAERCPVDPSGAPEGVSGAEPPGGPDAGLGCLSQESYCPLSPDILQDTYVEEDRPPSPTDMPDLKASLGSSRASSVSSGRNLVTPLLGDGPADGDASQQNTPPLQPLRAPSPLDQAKLPADAAAPLQQPSTDLVPEAPGPPSAGPAAAQPPPAPLPADGGVAPAPRPPAEAAEEGIAMSQTFPSQPSQGRRATSILGKARRYSSRVATQKLRQLVAGQKVAKPPRPPTTPQQQKSVRGRSSLKRKWASEAEQLAPVLPAAPNAAAEPCTAESPKGLLGGLCVLVAGMAKAWLPGPRGRPSSNRLVSRPWHDAEWYSDESRALAKNRSGMQLAARLVQLARRCGATVVETAGEVQAIWCRPCVVLAGQEEPTPLFLAAMAAGALPLHFSWLLHALAADRVPDWRPYLLVADHRAGATPTSSATHADLPQEAKAALPCVLPPAARLWAGQRVAIVGNVAGAKEVVEACGGTAVLVPTRKSPAGPEVDVRGCIFIVADTSQAVEADVPVVPRAELLRCVLLQQPLPPKAEQPSAGGGRPSPAVGQKRKRETALTLACRGPPAPLPAPPRPPPPPPPAGEGRGGAVSSVVAKGSHVQLLLAGQPRVGKVLAVERPIKSSPNGKERRRSASETCPRYTVQLYEEVLTGGHSERQLRATPKDVRVVEGGAVVGPAFVLPVTRHQFRHCTYWCPDDADPG